MNVTNGKGRPLAHRIERFVARALFRLPPSALVFLSGEAQRVVDGQALHPEMQFLLASRRRQGAPPLRAETAERARRQMLREARKFSADPLPLRSVGDLAIPSPRGELRARHYVPREAGAGPLPLLVFFHGGGFVVGDLETHDEACRLLCHHAGVQVLSVDYRLAPEHPFPAAIEDGEAAFRWAVENAASLGADSTRVGVGGDSAGGNVAAVVSLPSKDGAPEPAFQLLLYPVVDRGRAHPSHGHFQTGFFLERDDMEWFDNCYLGRYAGAAPDERIAPLLAAVPSRVPAIVVTAGFDPLRDEGEAYAARLEAHGTKVIHRRFSGLIHGFINMTFVSPVAHASLVEVAGLLRRTVRESRAEA
jgi:acetyl esterase